MGSYLGENTKHNIYPKVKTNIKEVKDGRDYIYVCVCVKLSYIN